MSKSKRLTITRLDFNKTFKNNANKIRQVTESCGTLGPSNFISRDKLLTDTNCLQSHGYDHT